MAAEPRQGKPDSIVSQICLAQGFDEDSLLDRCIMSGYAYPGTDLLDAPLLFSKYLAL